MGAAVLPFRSAKNGDNILINYDKRSIKERDTLDNKHRKGTNKYYIIFC